MLQAAAGIIITAREQTRTKACGNARGNIMEIWCVLLNVFTDIRQRIADGNLKYPKTPLVYGETDVQWIELSAYNSTVCVCVCIYMWMYVYFID